MTDGCSICEKRPAKVNGWCQVCYDRIEADKRESKKDPFYRYLVYQTEVVGLRKGSDGKTHSEWLKREPYDKDGKLRLPKSKTIDLNHYCEGYTRDQIKNLKRIVQVATAIF